MQLITLSGSFSRAPRLKRDGIINAGTQCLFDFGRAFCWPAQAAPVLASSFVNLVEPVSNVGGRQSASVDNNVKALGWESRGGIVFSGDADAEHARINLGKSYDVAGESDVLAVVWLRLPTCASFTSTRPILTFGDLGHPASPLSIYWEFNSGNPLVRGRCRAASQTTEAPDVGFAVGFDTLVQIGVRITRAAGTTTIRLYTNGVLRATNSTARVTWPLVAGQDLRLGSPNSAFSRSARMVVYRLWVEDLAESAADALAQLASDYAANATRFA